MGGIWCWVTILSCTCALVTGRAGETAGSILACGDEAVSLLLTLMAAMTLWSGLMEVMSECGDVQRIGKLFRRIAGPLFPGLADDACWSAMCMNISANMMGLGNAATPAGIEAVKRLAGQGKPGLRAIAMLLVINNCGLQLLPTTVLSLRQAAGSSDPAAIWLPTLLTSAAATTVGVGMMHLIQKGGGWYEWRRRHHDHGNGSVDPTQRHREGL